MRMPNVLFLGGLVQETLKDQHRAQTNQSETRSLNERKRFAEIKCGKPCTNDYGGSQPSDTRESL